MLICLSNTLSRKGSIEMGRKFERSEREPFFGTGQTLAILKLDGKIASLIAEFRRERADEENEGDCIANLVREAGILSCPGEELERERIIEFN